MFGQAVICAHISLTLVCPFYGEGGGQERVNEGRVARGGGV